MQQNHYKISVTNTERKKSKLFEVLGMIEDVEHTMWDELHAKV